MTVAAPTLRGYQVDMLKAVVAARQAGQNRLLCKAPTGTGKTVTFAAMPSWPHLAPGSLSGKDVRMLVIAHREELIDQAADKIQRQNPELHIGIEQADRYASPMSDVVIASIQTLTASKCKRLQRLLSRGPFNLVIIDEAHHAAAPSYRNALVHLGFLPPADLSDDDNMEAANFDDVANMNAALAGWDERAPKDRLLVGVTATPNRSDAIGLGCVFQTIAYSYNLKDAIDQKYLVPIVPWVIETKSVLDDVRLNRGDFNQRELADAVNNNPRNALAVAAWKEHASDRSTLAFTVDVAHAHALALEFRAAGVRAEALSGETPKEERRDMLRRYTAGELQLITNCMVLTEGTDLPRTGCILHAKPTKSPTLYEQMTGRGLRIHPGKTDCIVIDLVDVARRHSLQTAPVLYGLPPGLKPQGKKLNQLADEFAAFVEQHPSLDMDKIGRVTLEQLMAQARTFDIWSVREMGDYGRGLALKWFRTGDQTFRISYPFEEGDETIVVAPDLLGKFEIRVTRKLRGNVHAGPGHVAAPQVIGTGITSGQAALQLAEQFVSQSRPNVIKLKGLDAPWKRRPASEKQTALLRKLHIPFNLRTVTMGEASDLIDAHMLRKNR